MKNRRQKYIPFWVRHFYRWQEQCLYVVLFMFAMITTAIMASLFKAGTALTGIAAAMSIISIAYVFSGPPMQRRARKWVGKRMEMVLGVPLTAKELYDDALATWAWVIRLIPGRAPWSITRCYHEGRELIELVEGEERPEERSLDKRCLMKRHSIDRIPTYCVAFPHSALFTALVRAQGTTKKAA